MENEHQDDKNENKYLTPAQLLMGFVILFFITWLSLKILWLLTH